MKLRGDYSMRLLTLLLFVATLFVVSCSSPPADLPQGAELVPLDEGTIAPSSEEEAAERAPSAPPAGVDADLYSAELAGYSPIDCQQEYDEAQAKVTDLEEDIQDAESDIAAAERDLVAATNSRNWAKVEDLQHDIEYDQQKKAKAQQDLPKFQRRADRLAYNCLD